MTDEFWVSARDNGVELAITRYPIAFDYEAAEALCRAKGVSYEVFGDRGEDGAFLRIKSRTVECRISNALTAGAYLWLAIRFTRAQSVRASDTLIRPVARDSSISRAIG